MTFPEPEYHRHEEYKNRLAKLGEIRQLGLDPYPHKYTPSASVAEILKKYTDKEVGHSEDAANGSTEKVVIAGRLVLFRAMGKNAFAHIQDGPAASR